MAEGKGIDIRAALEILANRKCCVHGADVGAHGHDHNQYDVEPEGQIIDLRATDTSALEREAVTETLSGGKSNSREIQAALGALTVVELLRAVLSLQQDRVIAYRHFDESLDRLLTTDGYDHRAYTTCCAKATASFSLISDSIRAIAKILFSKYGRADLQKCVTELQQHEQRKLNLTTAFHLERIRQVAAKADSPTSAFLEQGVASLRNRLWECIEAINLVLDEIRCAVEDE